MHVKVSALVKGCNPIITVIQLDVRLTLQFFGLKKHCHRIITKPARTLFTSKYAYRFELEGIKNMVL